MLCLKQFPSLTRLAINTLKRDEFLKIYVMNLAVSFASRAGATENLKAQWVPLFVRDEESCPSGNRTLIDQGAIPIDSAVLSSTEHLSEWFTQKLGKNAQRLDIHRKYMSNEEQNLKAMVNEQIALF